MITQSALLDLIREILETEEDIAIDADLEVLGWDSLSDLTFISIADERYGRVIDPRALSTAETPADLETLLNAQRA